MNFPETSVSPFLQLLDNGPLTWGLMACGLAQLSKLFAELIQHRRWRPLVLLETGGMPSSHSAFVTGTASCVGWQMGFDHPGFAIASTLAFVVMYDASGIRRSAGFTAARVNQLSPEAWPSPPEDVLKESLGHSRLEVLVGGLIGPLVALPGLVFIGSPLQIAHFLNVNFG